MNPPSVPAPARDSWLVSFLSGAASDLRHAIRQLAKQRGFATVTLLTLALCIGANTAIFSAVYGLMLKPLPFSEPDRIVEIYNGYPKAGLPKMSSNVVTYLDFKQNAASFSAYGLWSAGPAMFGEDLAGERLWGARVTADFFDVLGVKPLVGRFFTLENSRVNEDKVLVLTQSFWTSQFQEDPAVLGKTARIGGETYTIIGVAPRAFESFDARVRFLRPFSWGEQQTNPATRHSNYIKLFARLKPGVAPGQALAEGQTLDRRYVQGADAGTLAFIERSGAHLNIGLLQAERVQPLRTPLLLLQGGVVFVLLIGCVNIANLLLARANGRQSELATRFALGATRGIIARQLLLETLLLIALGTVLGLALAWAGVAAMNQYRAEMMATTLPFAVDARVLGFTVGVSVVAALLISVVPILHVLRANLMELIHGSSRGASGSAGVRALSSCLIVGQVAVAIVLLTGAGLLIHSFVKAVSVAPGFEPAGVVTGRIAIPSAHRASDDAARTLRDRLEQTLREIPGVSSVAFSFAVPFQGGLPVNALNLAEDTLPSGAAQPGAFVTTVSPQYLETLRLRLIEGRFFEPSDAQPNARSVYVVDETFAKKYFAGKSAVGGRFAFGGRPANDADWPTIIGVVRNVPHNGVEERSGNPFVYSLLRGRPSGMTLFLRSSRPAAEMIDLLRDKLRTIDPTIALFDTGTVDHFIDTSFTQRRAIMLLLGIFAGLALFLSALGIYGVLSYDVAQRRREIGVRGAIGATHHQIVGLVMRQGIWKTAIGLALGLIGAVALSRFLQTLLFDLSPTDPRAYAIVSLLLLAVAALASYLPARRAAKINPIDALRVE